VQTQRVCERVTHVSVVLATTAVLKLLGSAGMLGAIAWTVHAARGSR
jgi:hypothetical protein